MLFNSLSFAVFMTVVFLIYWLVPVKLFLPGIRCGQLSAVVCGECCDIYRCLFHGKE